MKLKTIFIPIPLRDITLLLVILLVATALNPNWAFSPLKIFSDVGPYNDHWLYLAPMTDLTDKLQYVSETFVRRYSFERFSWVLPGALLYDTFPPLVANYILKFWVYIMSVGGIYWALYNLFGRKTAFFTALCLGGYAWFLRSAGWDYVDGIGIGYFLMAFASLIAGIKTTHPSRWKWYLFLSGILLVNVIVTNLYWGIFIPHILLIALWLNHKHHQRPIFTSIFLTICGGISITILYAFISFIKTGEWIFLIDSLNASTTIMNREWVFLLRSSDGKNLVLYDVVDFLYRTMTPYYQVVPLLLALVGIRWAVIPNTKRHSFFGLQRVLLLQFIWFYVLIIISHIILLPYLIVFLYSSYLIPVAFLWLGAVCAPVLENLSHRQYQLLRNTLITIFLTPFIMSILLPTTYDLQNRLRAILFCTAILCLGLFYIPRLRVSFIFLGIILLGWMTSKQIDVFPSNRLEGQNTFSVVFDAYHHIQSVYVSHGIRDIEYIYDPNTKTGIPLVVIPSLYFDGYYKRTTRAIETSDTFTVQTFPFREISQGQFSQKTILMTRYSHTFDKFMILFQNNRHWMLEIEKIYPIQSGDVRFYMYFIDIRPNPYFIYEFDTDTTTQTGFGTPETDNNRTYRWTSEPVSRISFSLDENTFDREKSYQVQFWALAPLEAEVLDSLSLTINGVQLELERIPQGADTLFQARIDGQILQGDVLELTFITNRISRPADFGYADPRTLGVAFDWLTITPIEDEMP